MAGNDKGSVKADVIKVKVAEFTFFIIRTMVAKFFKKSMQWDLVDFDAYTMVHLCMFIDAIKHKDITNNILKGKTMVLESAKLTK